jgi:hypothetical protein
MTRFAIPVVLAALLFAPPATAQQNTDIPVGYRPPPGMCRIWIDGVPAGQQSAPTDCATAIRNRPANGRVIFGDEYGKKEKKSRIPSGLFGGKDKTTPVKKLRDGGEDAPPVEPPKAEAPKTKPPAEAGDKKQDPKKAKPSKTKKPDNKSDI